MTTMTPAPSTVTGGVDTHADLHVAAAVDHLGGVLGTAQFATTPAGYRRLLGWLRTFGPLHQVGVEGTGSYGAALAVHLAEQGVEVIEVARPNRQVRRRHDKSDIVDAIAAARAVLSGEASATPKTHDGPIEGLRALKVVQRSANKARTQALNQLHALIATAPAELRERLRHLETDQLLRTCAAFRIPADDDSLTAVVRLALRELAQRVQHLDGQLKTVVTRLHRITKQVAPELVALQGVGPDVASTLLITAGDNPHRLEREQSFAAPCAASPIPATSGKTQNRHRLNRGGDRQANAALWRIALVRLSHDPCTRDYMNRRTSEGKNKTEVLRCLKRHIAREVFAALPDTVTNTRPDQLAA
ncbi:MAG: IS110 family transposase [Actinomycetota bacterium]|nr:IS110 family transposase [Actinomycetota bacterium]